MQANFTSLHLGTGLLLRKARGTLPYPCQAMGQWGYIHTEGHLLVNALSKHAKVPCRTTALPLSLNLTLPKMQ